MDRKKSYFVIFGLLVLLMALFGWGLSAQIQVWKFERARETVYREFDYKGKEFSVNMDIPLGKYLYYKEKRRPSWMNHNYRHPYYFFTEYVGMAEDPDDDAIIDAITGYLNEAAATAGFDEREKVELALVFVQSFSYIGDNVTAALDEYPRYPVETLFEREGDCEDTSILLAAILDEMGYDVALLLFEEFDHIGLGVSIPSEYVMHGNSWIYEDTRYWYLDTSGGRSIGWCPEPYNETSAYVYPVGK
jgi:hypothetical protein